MLDTLGMFTQSICVRQGHRGRGRRETLGRAGTEMECTPHPLAKSTGARDKERQQEKKDTGVEYRVGGLGQFQERMSYAAISRSPSPSFLVLPFSSSIFPPQGHRHDFQLPMAS